MTVLSKVTVNYVRDERLVEETISRDRRLELFVRITEREKAQRDISQLVLLIREK
jgi:hypothetical protein